jgi:6-phosphofructokinase 1
VSVVRVALGQTGAPTTVVDATVRGVLDGAAAAEVLAVRGGPDGLVHGRLEPVAPGDGPKPGARGGSWLGAGRRSVTQPDLNEIVAQLERHRVDVLMLIGGNGTMALLEAVGRAASSQGSALRVVGVPKTIDNDLQVVDHTPGFPSAARFLASVVPDLARDHAAMCGVEPVRVVETLGRSAGWLALAATWHRDDRAHAPHLVLLPEARFVEDRFLGAVDTALREHGRAFVVVSEGVDTGEAREPFDAHNHTRLLHGGVARRLAALVGDRLGLPARGEVLGMVQRSASAWASNLDLREAEQLGHHAARLALDGASGIMVGSVRDPAPEGPTRVAVIDLAAVAGRGRPVPDRWVTHDPRELDSFQDWLAPLIG